MDDGIYFYLHAGTLQNSQSFRLDVLADVLTVRKLGGQHLVRLVQNQDRMIPGAEDGGAEQVRPFLVPSPAVLGEVGAVGDLDAVGIEFLQAPPDMGLATAGRADEHGVGLDAMQTLVHGNGYSPLGFVLFPDLPVQVIVNLPGGVPRWFHRRPFGLRPGIDVFFPHSFHAVVVPGVGLGSGLFVHDVPPRSNPHWTFHFTRSRMSGSTKSPLQAGADLDAIASFQVLPLLEKTKKGYEMAAAISYP